MSRILFGDDDEELFGEAPNTAKLENKKYSKGLWDEVDEEDDPLKNALTSTPLSKPEPKPIPVIVQSNKLVISEKKPALGSSNLGQKLRDVSLEDDDNIFGYASHPAAADSQDKGLPARSSLFEGEQDADEERSLHGVYIPSGAADYRREALKGLELDQDLMDIPTDDSLNKFLTKEAKAASTPLRVEDDDLGKELAFDDDLMALANDGPGKELSADIEFDFNAYIASNTSSNSGSLFS